MSTEEKNETIVDKAKDGLASATTAAKEQFDALKTKEGREALKGKAKEGFTSVATIIKGKIGMFKTKEGRSLLVNQLKSMSIKWKIVLGTCVVAIPLLLLGVLSCVFTGGGKFGNGKSPIEGLMGYKLGEVLQGELGNKAILIGPDWYCVGSRVDFHGYNTAVKVLPLTRRVCAINVSSSKPGINLQTELATVEVMLRKKYKDIEFEKVSDLVSGWKPKSGSRVLLAGIMQHPLAPCVKIEVHDVGLESLMEKEKNEILERKASSEANKVGDVL